MSTSGVTNTYATGGAKGPDEIARQSPSTSAGSGGVSGATKIGNVKELREVSPEMWDLTLKSIAQNMCTESKRHTDKIIQEQKKARQG